MEIVTRGSQIDRDIMSAAGASFGLYGRRGKRCLDLAVSLVGIVLTLPILIACACAIKLESSGPVWFRQQRAGQGGRPFTLFKFRTMQNGSKCDKLKITVAGDPRVTRLGKWLRKTKLDELPQLFNVLSGDMSLVGPRPEVPEYVHYYDSRQRMVLQVKPGITGPASLAFIDESEILKEATDPEMFYRTSIMPKKLALDLEYCKTYSFTFDCQIACKTLARLLGLLV